MSGDSSDSESEHWGLFHVRDSADEVFYFERISIDEFDHDALVVQFVFSYCGEDEFTSDLRVDHIGTVMSDELYRTLFDIGMCVMTWYWMGYGCRNIVVSHDVASLAGVDERTIGYWRESYNNILAEYIYENKLSFHSVNLTYQSWDSRMSSGASQCIGCQAPRSACYEDIVPLGGQCISSDASLHNSLLCCSIQVGRIALLSGIW